MFERSHEDIINNMLSITSQKYDRSFTVEYFTAAKDSTHSNILTLSLDGYLFNVYQRGDGQDVWDDLLQAVASSKTVDYVRSMLGELPVGMELYGNFLYAGLNDCTLEQIVGMDVEELFSSKQLVKAVAVVTTAEPFDTCKVKAFRIYQTVLSLNPQYVDYELIQVRESDAGLEKMLNNLAGYYDSDWNRQKAVVASVAVMDNQVSSPDELIQR